MFICFFLSLVLTEKAFKNTRHCIIPSIVSPVRQNVPVRCRPLRPTAAEVARLAWTSARLGRLLPPARTGGRGLAALIKRSRESIIHNYFSQSSSTHFILLTICTLYLHICICPISMYVITIRNFSYIEIRVENYIILNKFYLLSS